MNVLQKLPGEILNIFEVLDTGVFVTNEKGIVVGINNYFETVTRIKKEDVLGRNVQYLLDKGYIMHSICQSVFQTQSVVTRIMHYKDNVEKDVIVTGKPIFDAAGKLKFIVCILHNWNSLNDLYRNLYDKKMHTVDLGSQDVKIEISDMEGSGFLAVDPRSVNLVKMALRIAKVDSSVLLLGESGVGKDMMARLIHRCSPRAQKGRFVHVNCGAIPAQLFESEFFGYCAGAFTGASKNGKLGLLEFADNGTMFLDEIAELPLFMQAKLLKVLQEKNIMRVGDTKERGVNIKVIAATNKNLKDLVAQGSFREDLFYRLNVFPLYIPGLRERSGDIKPLVELFLRKLNEKYKQRKRFDPKVIALFLQYRWPGNVRELENTIERMIVLCPGETITEEYLPESFGDAVLITEAIALSRKMSLRQIVEKVEKAVIMDSIKRAKTMQESAAQLGIDMSTLTRKKQKYGLCKHESGAPMI